MDVWRDAPTLTGRHVLLRPTEASDGEAIAAAAADGEQTRHFFANIGHLHDPETYVAALFRERDYGRSMPFTVCLPESGKVVGATRYLRINRGHKRLEIGGTFYAGSVQRSGVNTEAKRLLLGHAFEVMGCNVVEIRTDWFNRRSQAAIERLGAKRDGVLRAHQIMPDGRVRDTVVYSIIFGEWPGVRQNLDYLLAQSRR